MRTAQMARDSPIPNLLRAALVEKRRKAEEERKAARGRAEIEAEARKERDDAEIRAALEKFRIEQSLNPDVVIIPTPALDTEAMTMLQRPMRLVLEVNANRNARRRFGLDDPSVALVADVRFGGRVIVDFTPEKGGTMRETVFIADLKPGHVVHPQASVHVTVLRLAEDAVARGDEDSAGNSYVGRPVVMKRIKRKLLKREGDEYVSWDVETIAGIGVSKDDPVGIKLRMTLEYQGLLTRRGSSAKMKALLDRAVQRGWVEHVCDYKRTGVPPRCRSDFQEPETAKLCWLVLRSDRTL